MNIKKAVISHLFAVASLLFAADTLSMNDISTEKDIIDIALRVNEKCAKKCTLVTDITKACTRTCMEKNFKRVQDYHVRKHVAGCQGRIFNEKFNINPTIKEKCEELDGTINAYLTLDHSPKLKQCFESKMFDEAEQAFACERNVEKQLENARKENPIIMAAIDIKQKIRRQ